MHIFLIFIKMFMGGGQRHRSATSGRAVAIMTSGADSVKSEYIKINRSVPSATRTKRIFSPSGFYIRSHCPIPFFAQGFLRFLFQLPKWPGFHLPKGLPG
jgi:hypothetical protein